MRELTGGAVIDPAEAYWVPTGPHLRLNMVASLDGAASVAGRVGSLTGPADQRLLGTLRNLSDVLLVGAGTLRVEGYGPLTAGSRWRGRRAERGQTETPGLAIVSRRLELDPDHPVFTDAETRSIVITCQASPADRLQRLARVADVIVAGEQQVDLAQALAQLHHRGLLRVLSEGGPQLLSALFEADLVDELCLAVSPLLVGSAGHRITADAPFPDPIGLRLASVYTDEDFLFCRYLRGSSDE